METTGGVRQENIISIVHKSTFPSPPCVFKNFLPKLPTPLGLSWSEGAFLNDALFPRWRTLHESVVYPLTRWEERPFFFYLQYYLRSFSPYIVAASLGRTDLRSSSFLSLLPLNSGLFASIGGRADRNSAPPAPSPLSSLLPSQTV